MNRKKLRSFLSQQAHRMPPGDPQDLQPFGLTHSFNMQRERPRPTLNTRGNSTTSVTLPPLPSMWKDSQLFPASLGGSRSDFLLLLLSLPAVSSSAPCAISHAASPHAGPQPWPSFLHSAARRRLLSGAGLNGRFGLMGGGPAAQHGADGI